MRKGVLVTHADSPLGARIAETLLEQPRIGRVLLVGPGPCPRRLERWLGETPTRARYVRAELSTPRDAEDLFGSAAFEDAHIDAVVHVPDHGRPAAEPRGPGNVPARTTEARIVLRQCQRSARVRHLVAVGSAFVYRLLPGNANRIAEDQPLELDPAVPPDVRAWVDCDLLFREESRTGRLRLVLLRIPTLIAGDGGVTFNPLLASESRFAFRPAGFDPLCAVVADGDVAEAVRAALLSRARGAFNVAGVECVPLSVLERWRGRSALPLPGPILLAADTVLRFGRRGASGAGLDGPHWRYGFSLDTKRAQDELAFRPRFRIHLGRSGEGVLHLEPA